MEHQEDVINRSRNEGWYTQGMGGSVKNIAILNSSTERRLSIRSWGPSNKSKIASKAPATVWLLPTSDAAGCDNNGNKQVHRSCRWRTISISSGVENIYRHTVAGWKKATTATRLGREVRCNMLNQKVGIMTECVYACEDSSPRRPSWMRKNSTSLYGNTIAGLRPSPPG